MNTHDKEVDSTSSSATPQPDPVSIEGPSSRHPKGALFGLALAALGVVYGDLGTSPLYALRMCFSPQCGVPVRADNILGVLSLIVWSLILMIAVKYIGLVLRADNRGEGGVLALMVLAQRYWKSGRRTPLIVLIGLFGASLLYGDGLITPAISVLSAVEGLNMATSVFQPWVVPLCLAILIGLFWVQRRGTHQVGSIFGPVMVLWFTVIAVLGLVQTCRAPAVLAALHPGYAIEFFQHNRWQGFVVLGSVFLTLTGGEALYADMGHFGPRPIRVSGYALVLPALLLNYFGQAAWLLGHPSADQVDHLFYRIVPGWGVYPMIALATTATVIASQAVISGVFSLTRQAIQLGYCPRLTIVHTSEHTIGQVYMPEVNATMLVGTVLLVLGFRNSDRLAGAYGVAVSMTMLITTLMLTVVMRRDWRWPWAFVGILLAPFLLLETAFLGSNLLKIGDGGWVPLSLAAVSILFMTTWRRGRELLSRKMALGGLDIEEFLADVARSKPLRVPGVAVFLTGKSKGIPRTLLHNYKHNKILHAQTVLLTVCNEDIPRVPEKERARLTVLPAGFYQVTLRYGFSEDPDIPAALKNIRHEGLNLNPRSITFFLGRETLLLGADRQMWPWRKRIFAFLSRNARDASKFFHIPPNRVIEVGIQVEL